MFILLRRSSNAAETLGTAMRLKPITATARRQGHRRKYLPTARPEGEADQYFRTGPTGGRPEQDGRSLPLSTRCRLTLHQCCEWEYRSPPAAEFACRATAAASVTGGIVARRREFRGRMAAHGDHRSARRHSRGSGSRLWPVPLPHEYYSRIIISASANSVRTAPPRRGAKNKRPGWF